MKKEENEKKLKQQQNLNNGSNSMSLHMKKNSLSGGRFFVNDLDKELQAAEKFLSKNNDEILRSTNRDDKRSSKDTFNSNEANQPKVTKSSSGVHSISQKLDQALIKYQKQLKAFGFPEIGNFYFPSDSSDDKEKTLRFFDYIIMKKSTENEDKMKFKKQIDILTGKIASLQTDNEKLEKELISVNEEMKKVGKHKKDFEGKLNKTKENLEKQLNDLKSINSKLTNKYHTLLAEKKAVEEKFNKVAEGYQKLINKQNVKAANHIDLIDNLKRNDILRLLSKVKGTEKLIDTFKNGYNESLRELLFEVSALKNFIFEINSEIMKTNDSKFMEIDYNILNMPFLDTVNKIKYVIKNNLKLLTRGTNSINEKEKDYRDNTLIFDENKILSGMYNDLEMTFDKKEVISGNSGKGVYETNINPNLNDSNSNSINKNLIFDIDEIKGNKANNNISREEDNYENELEFLKNKWVKTLMNIKDKTNSSNSNEKDDD